MTFDADIVWGCAVAINRINKGYFKEDIWNYNTNAHFISKRANKKVVKEMLATQDFHNVTEEDIAKGKELRHYFNGYLLKEVSGKINDFERQALRIAQMDEFTNRQLLEFAIISCLPASMDRDKARNQFKNDVFHSTPLVGDLGDYILAECTIIKSYYNENYERYRITGRMGESFVDFWFKQDLLIGSTVKITARIKAKRADHTTQLSYVRLK